MIVVDDGSIDKTAQVVTNLGASLPVRLVRHQVNRGKGRAVRTGVLAAKGDWVLMADADDSVPITELEKLWAVREEFDVIIASRFLGESRLQSQAGLRLIVSKIGNLLFRRLFHLPIRDTQCGFKLFRREQTRPLFKRLISHHYGFDMEILVRAEAAGLTIREVPIYWRDVAGSSFRAVQASWETLWELLHFWHEWRKSSLR